MVSTLRSGAAVIYRGLIRRAVARWSDAAEAFSLTREQEEEMAKKARKTGKRARKKTTKAKGRAVRASASDDVKGMLFRRR
jgi:hypothetical protein